MSRILMYFIRHGETKANNPRSSTFRGWSDVPLDEDGKKTAAELAKKFSSVPLSGLVTSDIPRAVETAQTISPSAQPDPGLRPWNVGIFTGKSREQYLPKIKKFIDSPDQPIPRGESLNDFKSRVVGTVRRYAQEAQKATAPLALVAHGSVLTAIKREFDPKSNAIFLHDNEVEPGGVLALTDAGKLERWNG